MVNEVIANARVTLEGKFNTIVQTTNEKGEVNFTNVPPDTYTVLVQKEGYKDTILTEPIIIQKDKNNHHKHDVKLEKNKPKTQVEVDTRTLIIQTKTSGARVSLQSYENKERETLLCDEKGEAIFEEVPFGNYELQITKIGYHKYSRDILVNKNNRLERKIPCKLKSIIGE